MTAPPISLDELNVIGYADALPGGKGPAVLPPVFRHRSEPDRCYLPPFRLAGNWIVDAQCVSLAEVEQLRQQESITLPNDFARPAVSDHQLWVDEIGTAHYEPVGEARRNLRHIYSTHLRAAVAALRAGRFDDARQSAGIALAADDRAVEPRALIAALHCLRGEAAQAAFMKRSAEQATSDAESFIRAMESYLESIPPATWATAPLNVDQVICTCTEIGIDVWIPFSLTEEEFGRFHPILHQYRRAGGEREFTLWCPGVEARLLAERQFLNLIWDEEAVKIAMKKSTLVLSAASKAMLYETARIASSFHQDTHQLQILGRLVRDQIRPSILATA